MAYRDDDDAWLARRVAMARRIADEADLEERGRLVLALDRFDRDRRTLLRRRLPTLARATCASACDEPFEAMHGDGGARSCTRCDAEVIDPARVTIERVRAIGDRAFVRADGTVIAHDCVAGRSARWTRRAALVVTLAAVAVIAIAIATQPRPHWPTREARRAWWHAIPASGVRYVHDRTRDGADPSTVIVPFSYFARATGS